jgi:flagellar biosynthesis protein FlhB
MAENRTEKATPKRRDEARKKGQVARSADINGAAVLMASLLALSAFGPAMWERIATATREMLVLTTSPDVVSRDGIGELLATTGEVTLLAVAPVAVVCALAGLVASVAQVGFKPAPGAMKPDFKKINPLTGAKNLFGPNAIFETGKSVTKVAVVGAIAALAVFPKLSELAALVGMPPAALVPMLAQTVLGIAQRAAAAYLVIAFADFGYQRWRHEKQLRMDKQEVKDEFKQTQLPQEVRGQMRRRAMSLSQSRMMDAVPTADVVVTNPTHYSVALRYDPEQPAPIVVAKGKDHLAFRIREIAGEHGVAIVPDPPLARSLHATVEVGHMIPEELFQAVAQLLAYFYRVARRSLAS